MQINGTGSHVLAVPYPYNGPLYMIVGPEPVDITMVEFDLASDRFSVGGLPRNTPYVISDDDGNDVGAGVTSGSGSISKTLGSISRDMEPGDGGVLRLYPGAPHYDGYINVVSFDMRNNARVDNHHGSNSTFAYVPVIYARLAFIADAQVDHVTLKSKILGDINMDHLAGSYLRNQALMVPILPGATALDLTINGFEMSVLVSDMRVEEGPGFIIKETNSHASDTRSNYVRASSAATSNAFAIATSNGTMTVDVTVWLTGEAEISLDTAFDMHAERNKCHVRMVPFYPGFHYVRTWAPDSFHNPAVGYGYTGLYKCSLYGASVSDADYNYWANHLGIPMIADVRAAARQVQWENNRDYDMLVQNQVNSISKRPIGASIDVYKNGEYLKTMSFIGSTPIVTSTYIVSGLPMTYFPDNISWWVYRNHCEPDCSTIHYTEASWTTPYNISVRQNADVTYPSSTLQALVEVDVDTGDMMQFVIKARLITGSLLAPPMPTVNVDPRMYVNGTDVASNGQTDATITIEGGSIDIFCCSE